MFNDRSLKLLSQVHPDLVSLSVRALELSKVPFIITEGLRSLKRQRELVALGASHTLHSKHLMGAAVDVAALVEGRVRWDWPLYYLINEAYSQASCELSIPYVWGGSWKSFPDGPHFELLDT